MDSVKEVFEMEYRLTQAFNDSGEFTEGVRALLVDKDKSPKWKHGSIADVTQEEINSFFDYPAAYNMDIAKY